MAEQCGVKRMGTNIVDSFTGALNYLVDTGMVEVKGDKVIFKQ